MNKTWGAPSFVGPLHKGWESITLSPNVNTLGENALVGLFLAGLLAVAFARQRLLHAHLLAWLHVIRVPLDLFDDVFLLHLALEAAQCIFQRFAFLNLDFCQKRLHLPTLRLDTL